MSFPKSTSSSGEYSTVPLKPLSPFCQAVISKILIAAYGLIVRQRIVYRKLCLSLRPLRLHRVCHTHIAHLVRDVILSGRV